MLLMNNTTTMHLPSHSLQAQPPTFTNSSKGSQPSSGTFPGSNLSSAPSSGRIPSSFDRNFSRIILCSCYGSGTSNQIGKTLRTISHSCESRKQTKKWSKCSSLTSDTSPTRSTMKFYPWNCYGTTRTRLCDKTQPNPDYEALTS